MPNLPPSPWSYTVIKVAIIGEFYNEEILAIKKTEFMNYRFKLNETISEFCNRFYLDAQSLTGKKMDDSFAKIALQHALKLYYNLTMAMMPAFIGSPSTRQKVDYLNLLTPKFGDQKLLLLLFPNLKIAILVPTLLWI